MASLPCRLQPQPSRALQEPSSGRVASRLGRLTGGQEPEQCPRRSPGRMRCTRRASAGVLIAAVRSRSTWLSAFTSHGSPWCASAFSITRIHITVSFIVALHFTTEDALRKSSQQGNEHKALISLKLFSRNGHATTTTRDITRHTGDAFNETCRDQTQQDHRASLSIDHEQRRDDERARSRSLHRTLVADARHVGSFSEPQRQTRTAWTRSAFGHKGGRSTLPRRQGETGC